MTLDEMIAKANEMLAEGWRFEFYRDGAGWFVNPSAEHWMLRTPQGAALPFYAALEKTLRTVQYLATGR